jgi:alpha-glucosidase
MNILDETKLDFDWRDSIFSDGTETFVSNSRPKVGDTIDISIRVFKEAPVKRIYLRYLKNGEETVVLMEKKEERGKFQFFRANVYVNQPVINYHFIILTEDTGYFYNQMGVFNYNITEEYDFKILASFQEPAWVRESIFYQIFVDRFCNGDSSNDVKDDEYSYDGYSTKFFEWNEKPGKYEQYGNLDFFGGDLKGIEDKIMYLKKLGINAIYLNPIFEAVSNHKYDCMDYFNVDKHFGGNEALESLVLKLHNEGIKVILDISINHTGNTHPWFKNNKEYYHTNEQGESEYWNGIKSLPVLNYSNKSVRNIMYKEDNSALKCWLKAPYDIDGWRFDVGHNVGKMNLNQMDREVWREVRKEIKTTNSESYMVAEHWTDCSGYLQGDMWDGTMNYFGFLRPVRKYFGENDKFLNWKIDNIKMKTNDAEVFKEEVLRHYCKLPFQLQGLQLNLLSSHDLHRFHNSPSIDKENIISAIIMLFTFLGTPCVYYGDEVGLAGEFNTGEGCRYPMEWKEEKWNKGINKIYNDMIALRKNENILKHGSFKILLAKEKLLSYARFNTEEAIVFVNSQYESTTNANILVEILGEISEIETIYGDNKEINIENGYVVFSVKPKETLLLRIHFKA